MGAAPRENVMFAAAESIQAVDDEAFEREAMELRTALLVAQRELRDAGRAVVVIVSGVEGSRKSEVVNRLCEWLDARGVATHAFWDETDVERERPYYWRFWQRMPPRGTVGLMFGSWYTQPIVNRALGMSKEKEFERELAQIVSHETLLARDGTVFVKLWFHLSKKDQAKRLRDRGEAPAKKKDKKRAKQEGKKGDKKQDKQESEQKGKKGDKKKDKKDAKAAEGKKGWKLSPLLEQFAARYDDFALASERAIARTHTDLAPWHVIGASNRNHRDLAAGRALLSALEQAATPVPRPAEVELPPQEPGSVLDRVDLERRLSRAEYDEALEREQTRLNGLVWELRTSRRSCVAVFEGWDAAGKGGAIRRVAAPADARLYRVVPIAAPSDEERAQHYLWRFWRHVPGAGRLRIFDRSWYGRVLVERVEGFARPDEWLRAYEEINDFEAQLSGHGIGIAKFWLHLSKEEQLARFKRREEIPWKRHKITPDDWRNRERWDDYVDAIDDMVERTSTPLAPWSLIAGNDKRHARVEVVRILCDTIERTLGE